MDNFNYLVNSINKLQIDLQASRKSLESLDSRPENQKVQDVVEQVDLNLGNASGEFQYVARNLVDFLDATNATREERSELSDKMTRLSENLDQLKASIDHLHQEYEGQDVEIAKQIQDLAMQSLNDLKQTVESMHLMADFEEPPAPAPAPEKKEGWGSWLIRKGKKYTPQAVKDVTWATKEYALAQENPWRKEKYSLHIEDMRAQIEAEHPDMKEKFDSLVDPSQENPREQYRTFLDKLRVGDSAVAPIAKAHYTSGKHFSFHQKVITMVMQNGLHQLKDSEETPFYELSLERQFEAIEHASPHLKEKRTKVLWGNFKGTMGPGFDPNREQNVPYLQYRMNIAGKQVENIRMATPTMRDFQDKAARIVPEFWHYLDQLETEGKRHLYVSLQNRLGGSDKDRSQQIEGAGKDHPALDVVVFDQDSEFYKKCLNATATYEEFKAKYMDQLLSDESNYAFPSEWKNDPNFAEEISQKLEWVKEDFFPDNRNLSVEEQKDFLELSYAYFTLFFIQKSGADYFNMACKDAIDRAGKCNSILFQILLHFNNLNQDGDAREQLEVLTHAPAFMAKKQAIILERRERLIPIRKRLDDSAISQRIAARANQFGFDPQGFILPREM